MIKSLNRPCPACGENLTLQYTEETRGSLQSPNLRTIRRSTERAYCKNGHDSQWSQEELDA